METQIRLKYFSLILLQSGSSLCSYQPVPVRATETVNQQKQEKERGHAPAPRGGDETRWNKRTRWNYTAPAQVAALDPAVSALRWGSLRAENESHLSLSQVIEAPFQKVQRRRNAYQVMFRKQLHSWWMFIICQTLTIEKNRSFFFFFFYSQPCDVWTVIAPSS